MNPNTFLALRCLTVFLCVAMVMLGYGYLHEMSHRQVCYNFGGEPSGIHYGLTKWYVTCDIPYTEMYALAQSEAEIQGYIWQTVILLLSLGLFWQMFLSKEERT